MQAKTILTLLFLYLNCSIKLYSQFNRGNDAQKVLAKFEPVDGECLFFIGQDLKAIGGLSSYMDGYCNSFDFPAGFTTYTNFSPGSESFGYIQKGNDGIKSAANWGAEDNCAQCLLDNIEFKNCLLAIGLSMVNNEKEIAFGRRDYLIRELAQWIKDANRPIFLRIGYEFDGWEWNHYNKKYYLKAWKQVRSIFKEMEVSNVAFVWQSKGNGSSQDVLEKWYPGDDLVDWCGYSYFGSPDEEMLIFARKHKKPVFIAEATPVLQNGKEFLDTQLTNPKIAVQAWDNWFLPFIKTLNNNKDVIKAFSYINVNWSIQPMWINNPVFQKVDSRIQKSAYISEKWKEEMKNPRYLRLGSKLWNDKEIKNNNNRL